MSRGSPPLEVTDSLVHAIDQHDPVASLKALHCRLDRIERLIASLELYQRTAAAAVPNEKPRA